jgi:methylated-DNA-protein-cysteine methyltransferase related protein
MKRGVHNFKAPTFSERVVAAALAIPPGKVATYGAISRAAGGGVMSSQSITGVLSKAYEAGQHDIPFHRIVYADGRIWIDAKHRAERMRLYRQEGIEIDSKGRIKNFQDHLFEF